MHDELDTGPEVDTDPTARLGEDLVVMALGLRPHLDVVDAAVAEMSDLGARFLLQNALGKIREGMERYDEGCTRLDREVREWLDRPLPIDPH